MKEIRGSGSARWVGVFEFEESDYDFTITTDGSALLYVDGEKVIGLSETSAKLPLEEGLHSIKVEYFAGTSITLDWGAFPKVLPKSFCTQQILRKSLSILAVCQITFTKSGPQNFARKKGRKINLERKKDAK
jgi:hypothetical protein